MLLGINIDHVATLRNARGGIDPDPVCAVPYCEMAGADSITVHLREDRRHINERDLQLLKNIVSTKLNLEMALNDEIITIALAAKPDQVTIVPERREEITTEGGLNVIENSEKLLKVIKKFRRQKIEVALFIDPDEEQVKASQYVGADAIEIHTGQYCNASGDNQEQEKERVKRVTKFGVEAGLEVHAGHGLNYKNVGPIANILDMAELNIGHSIISRAIFVGIENAVREMKKVIKEYLPS